MTVVEFRGWPKIARLNRDIVISEKIDGTNAAILIVEAEEYPASMLTETVIHDGVVYDIYAQSRTRFINPDMDNHGFATWVASNAQTLVEDLGPGRHFGEWWGSSINRGYGLPKGEKRFSLFNTSKWDHDDFKTQGMGVVPVLYDGPFSERAIQDELDVLKMLGSTAALREGVDFNKPEGIIVFHVAANTCFKVTIENDAQPKGQA